jgi:hypothetical protein
MSLSSFLFRLFCGGCLDSVESLSRVLEGCRDRLAGLQEDYDDLVEQHWSLLRDVDGLNDELSSLRDTLAGAIVLPDVSEWTSGGVEFDPWSHEWAPWPDNIADERYLVFPYEDWTEVLRRVQPNVRVMLRRRDELFGKWRSEVSDCDNFASTMSALVAGAFAKAGLSMQGAFMRARSESHAYNLFMDTEKVLWVYEPQSGETVCRVDEADEERYETYRFWFMV